MECYDLCAADGTCTDFTLNSIRGTPTCYLLDSCTLNTDDFCLDSGTCKSGPKDCDAANTNANCLAIDSAQTAAGNIHWQCTDIDGVPFNGYTAGADGISAGSVCVLRCESWEAQDGTDGYLTSTCLANGDWEATKASDGTADLAFPQPDTTYPTPADEQVFACGCQNLEVVWPLGAAASDQWWYDPSDEEGTDFVCNNPIDTENGNFIIETGNTCILFCDSHLVADVRCINGEWTGQPELGFWCYKQPVEENGLGPVETEEEGGDSGL